MNTCIAIFYLFVSFDDGTSFTVPQADYAICEKNRAAWAGATRAACIRGNYGPDRSPVQ